MAGKVLVPFIGPPGSGKGTYAKLLVGAINAACVRAGAQERASYVDVGSALRSRFVAGMDTGGDASAASVDANADAGRRAVEGGGLVCSSVVQDLVRKEIERQVDGYVVVLDGFPRTGAQAEWLLRRYRVPLVFSLNLHEEALIQKCIGRLTCTQCGVGFNDADVAIRIGNGDEAVILPHLPPPHECVDLMARRADDTAEVVRTRLQVFRRERDAVLDAFDRMHFARHCSSSTSRAEDFRCGGGSTSYIHDIELTRGIPESAPLIADLALDALGLSSSSSSSHRPRAQVGVEAPTAMEAYSAPTCGLRMRARS